MSGGRVELGLGSGWFDGEHHAYGIPFPDLGERFDRLEEQLAVITGLWETPVGETFSFPGTHYPVTDSPALPKPVQSPRPPIIVGGHGAKRTPRLAATYADEFNLPFAPMADFTTQKERVSAACEARDRDPATMTWSVALTTAMGADEAEFTRRADAILHTPDQLRNDQLGGTPEEIRDRLGQWADLGAERVYLQVLDLADLDHIAQLGEELIGRVDPHLENRNRGRTGAWTPRSRRRAGGTTPTATTGAWGRAASRRGRASRFQPAGYHSVWARRLSRLQLSDSDSWSLES